MKYALESYADVIEEIQPLLLEHYNEIALHKDIPLNPDWERYKKMEELDALRIYTCRLDDNTLIGYGIYMVMPHLHYMSCVCAYQDIIFIQPQHRGRGLKFILWCDEQLKKNGVNMTVQHVKAKHNFGKALELIGYELMDLIYTRRL